MRRVWSVRLVSDLAKHAFENPRWPSVRKSRCSVSGEMEIAASRAVIRSVEELLDIQHNISYFIRVRRPSSGCDVMSLSTSDATEGHDGLAARGIF